MSLLIGTTFELVWRISDEQSLNEGLQRIKAAGPLAAVLADLERWPAAHLPRACA